jgi:hypothetical protein
MVSMAPIGAPFDAPPGTKNGSTIALRGRAQRYDVDGDVLEG